MSGLPDDGEDLFGFLYRKVFSPEKKETIWANDPSK